jgi:hypothetical protein
MFPNNYGHTGSDDRYAPLTSAQNHVQNDTLKLLVPGPGSNLRHCPHADSSAPRSTARYLGGIVGWPMAATTLCE